MTWPIDERRASLRRNLRVKVQIELPENFTDDLVIQYRRCAFARNIGLEGILILSSISIPSGTCLRIWIPFYEYDKTLELTGEVTRCVQTELGYEVALKFAETNPIANSFISQYVVAKRNKV
ncbi:MAG: PilZ domain-containing protein [Planctomycetota bacterium]|jgi:hypothetical protein